MDRKLLEVVVEKVAKKFLHDEDEVMLVSKLMLKVLKNEATVDEAIRGRSISAGKLSEYVEAARLALKRFDASVDEAVSQVRRSSTGRGQLQMDDSDDDVIVVKQDAVDKAESVPLVSAVNAPLAPMRETNDSQPPKKKACKHVDQRTTGTKAASIAERKKLNDTEPKHAKTDEELLSEFDMPAIEVLIDDNDLLPSPTFNGEATKEPATTGDDLGTLEMPALSKFDVNDANNNTLKEAPATEKTSMKYSTAADGTFTCEHCGQTFKNLRGLSVHYLHRHAPDEDVFICEQCGVKCLAYKLQRHMRLKHSGAHGPEHVDEQPTAPSLPKESVAQSHATTFVNGSPIDDAGESSTGWLLAMCNVTVKNELTE